MMLDLRQVNQIFLVCGKTDLRKGIDGLADIVQQEFDLDPYQKSLFCFVGHVKIALKLSFGRVTASYYFTKDWKMVASSGQLIKLQYESFNPNN